MNKTSSSVPSVEAKNQVENTHDAAAPLDVFLREFSQEAGKRVGVAIAQEIHDDPEIRRAAATGAGVGVGVVVGLGLLALAVDQ